MKENEAITKSLNTAELGTHLNALHNPPLPCSRINVIAL